MTIGELARLVLVVDDEPVVRTGIAQALGKLGFEVQTAATGAEGLRLMAARPAGIVLLDVRLPDLGGMEVLKSLRQDHPDAVVIVITGYPNIGDTVASIKQGAFDYLVKPFHLEQLEALVARAREVVHHRVLPKAPLAGERDLMGLETLVGQSPAMQTVFAKIRRAAPSDSTVLLTGESGTGKELAARAIHQLSHRKHKEFVPVDCSALVESLLESELFGHVKGSFTGAHQTKHGLFELANYGTFFFDEIANLSLNIQAKLLRVIQEREFMQVGSQRRIQARHPHHRLLQPGFPRGHKSGHFPGRPVLPPKRRPHPPASLKGAHRRHPFAGGPFHPQIPPEEQAGGDRRYRRGHEAA